MQKGGDYLKELKVNIENGQQEIESCSEEIASLTAQLELLHNSLPNGDGVIRRGSAARPETSLVKTLFNNHVSDITTKHNWKYWIYSRLMVRFFESFNSTVRNGNINELARTSYAWLDQNFNFPQSRGTITSALTRIATETSILSEPEKLPEQSVEAAIISQASSSDALNANEASVPRNPADQEKMLCRTEKSEKTASKRPT